MTVKEFREIYPFLSQGKSDEEIKQMLPPDPEPSIYYFDKIRPHCHVNVAWAPSYLLDCWTGMIQN